MASRLCVVTGAAGFIGSHLVDRLLALGWTVLGVDNLALGRESNLKPARGNPRLYFKVLDVNRPADFAEFLAQHSAGESIEVIWHLAANSDIQAGGDNPDVDLNATFLTTYNSLRIAQRFDVTQFCFASTSAIYGEYPGLIREDSGPLFPISNYGAMKLGSEGLITAALERFLKRVCIFRFPNVIGPRSTHGAIHDFIAKLRKHPDELEVLGDGTQEKPYLHVSELIDAMIHVYAGRAERLEFFNIAPDGSASTVRFMAEEVVRQMAPGARIRYTGGSRGWVGDVAKFQYSIEKMKAAGWAPKMTSNQAVELAIQENLAGTNG